MLDFRKHRRPARGLPVPRFLLVLIGLGVFLFIVTWRSKPVGDIPVPPAPVQDRTGARLGDAPPGSAAGARGQTSDADDYFPGVHAQYLDAVRDDTVFRAAESDAWFQLLELLEKNSDERLAAASSGPVGYLQLDRQPEAYRGRLVTVSGIVRGAQEIAAPENAYDIERYYQIWLQPLRSEPELIVVYALHLPLNFPVGEELDEPVSATGFFFKRWAYPARSGILTAPLVLARTIQWTPTPTAATAAAPEEQGLLAVAAAGLFAVCFVAWVWWRSQRPRPAGSTSQVGALDAQALGENTDQTSSP